LWEVGIVRIPNFDTCKPTNLPWSVWHDTADLAVWSHLPRSLAGAVLHLFRTQVDKSARSNMDRRHWADLTPAEQQVMLEYALDDAVWCWALWASLAPKWPEHERALSLHTGEIEFRGIPVDRARVERDVSVLESAKFALAKQIPWFGEEDENGKPYALRSTRAMRSECVKAGVPPPSSTSLKSKDFLDWLDEYGDKVPAIRDLSRLRRVDRALGVYRHLLARIRPDGRAALGLKYFGAEKTGRWAGTAKFNLQNMLKTPLYFDAEFGWLDGADGSKYAVDTRACFVASPGNSLIVADLSQIEPRVLNWVVGNREFLDLCAAGASPYEAHARTAMGWTGGKLKQEDPAKYSLAKARILALGYMAGWSKFIEMARGYLSSEAEFLAIFGAAPPEGAEERFLDFLAWCRDNKLGGAATQLRLWGELDRTTQNVWVNAWVQVSEFRASNPLLSARDTGLWSRLNKAFRDSYADGVFENELPSGRSLIYYDVSPAHGWSARQGHPGARPTRIYGGKLTENLVQAIARDLFGLGILALEAAGLRVLFHVHDEVIVDAPAGTDPATVIALLTQRPTWAATLPIAAEAQAMTCYHK
jgi:hypothetical protein